MARLFRVAVLLSCLFAARSAVAAGGSCPTGANYVNLNGQTGVTLANLGITNCYYIAASGSDSNTGTDESNPWQHSPGMGSQCTGNCATLQTAIVGYAINGGQAAGIGLIFRGGDVWHEGNSSPASGAYTGGGINFNVTSGTTSGTATNPFYIGVDLSSTNNVNGTPTGWYSGSSWTRPVISGDNENIQTTQPLTVPCSYQTTSNFFNFISTSYIVLDDFEMRGMCTSGPTTSDNRIWNQIYLAYGSMNGWGLFTRLYIHGWTHTPFNNQGSGGGCTLQYNGECSSTFRGSGLANPYSTSPPGGDYLYYNVIDGSDSDAAQMEGYFANLFVAAYNYWAWISQGVTKGMHLFHDNWINHFVNNGHANVMESVGADVPGPSGQYAVYNNIFSHLYVDAGSAGNSVGSNVVFWYQAPCPQGTPPAAPPACSAILNWFNNIVYDAGPSEFWNGPHQQQNFATQQIFNNTFQIASNASDTFSCGISPGLVNYVAYNNHWINDQSSTMFPSKACVSANVDMLSMTNSKASKSYTPSAATYVYSPTSADSPTVGKGANMSSACSSLSSAAGIDPTLSDAASACSNDTRYACSYDSTNHVMNCPARTPVARGATWDIGAYQYNSGQAVAPNPPVGLQATVQ